MAGLLSGWFTNPAVTQPGQQPQVSPGMGLLSDALTGLGGFLTAYGAGGQYRNQAGLLGISAIQDAATRRAEVAQRALQNQSLTQQMAERDMQMRQMQTQQDQSNRQQQAWQTFLTGTGPQPTQPGQMMPSASPSAQSPMSGGMPKQIGAINPTPSTVSGSPVASGPVYTPPSSRPTTSSQTPQSGNPVLASLPPAVRALLPTLSPADGASLIAQYSRLNQPDLMDVGGIIIDKRTGQQVADYTNVIRQNAMAGRNMMTVNMPPEQSASAKKLGELDAQAFSDVQNQGLQATSQMAKLDRLGALLNQVGTGKYTGQMVEFKKSLAALGFDPASYGLSDNMAVADAAKPLINGLALDLRSTAAGGGMPGAMSDADRNFLQSMVPNLETSPAAVPVMIDFSKRLAQRQADLAKVGRDYRKKNNGNVDAGMYQAFQDYSDTHPLFTQADAQKIQSMTPYQPGQPPTGPSQPQGNAAPVTNDPLAKARDAISRGADRNAVIQRLKAAGIDPSGL